MDDTTYGYNRLFGQLLRLWNQCFILLQIEPTVVEANNAGHHYNRWTILLSKCELALIHSGSVVVWLSSVRVIGSARDERIWVKPQPNCVE